ncbi:MAG: TIGR02996 domain-containing protein [Bacteroidales bacterium]|nr:TIGR02996 domain-containing protein [Bacteroidales bacterium]
MSDADALIAAATAAPDDDLPRLVLADWIEEQGDSARAAFLRAQVQLGQAKPWEPFAITCRHHRRDWLTGQPWRHTLPALPARGLEWHPIVPFHRGLPWSLLVRDLTAFLEHASEIFDLFPIGQLHLPTGTLDQWRAFARGHWLNRVRSIHFFGTATPIEPVRELCGSPWAAGIRELVFEVAGRSGMPEVLRGLLNSPLARNLNSLELRAIGSANGTELVDVLAQADLMNLTHLGLSVFPATPRNLTALAGSPLFPKLEQLAFRDSPITGDNLPNLFPDPSPARRDRELVALDLTGCAVRELSALRGPSSLRCVYLARNPLGDAGVVGLSHFWHTWRELDLRGNAITDVGVDALLAGERPTELVALRLDDNLISAPSVLRLRQRFGETIVITSEHTPTNP